MWGDVGAVPVPMCRGAGPVPGADVAGGGPIHQLLLDIADLLLVQLQAVPLLVVLLLEDLRRRDERLQPLLHKVALLCERALSHSTKGTATDIMPKGATCTIASIDSCSESLLRCISPFCCCSVCTCARRSGCRICSVRHSACSCVTCSCMRWFASRSSFTSLKFWSEDFCSLPDFAEAALATFSRSTIFDA